MENLFNEKNIIPPDFIISMPIGANILTAQLQSDNVVIWAEIDDSVGLELRYFEVFMNGQPIPRGDRIYLGTIQNGYIVLHIYEKH